MSQLHGVITAIGNRQARDRRLPLVVSCWMRVEFRIKTGIPSLLKTYGHVDLRLSEEAYAVVLKRFEDAIDLAHVVVEYDEHHNVTFLALPFWLGDECETRTVEAILHEDRLE